ncbi:hypothetical protein OAI47_01915 [Rhodospirillaceae bacterium]|nr:hypothetical protein [Rhodospirillaceae bacterium]
MNLDTLWRQPLQDPKTNKAITQTAVEIVNISIKMAIKYNILRLDALEIFTRDTEIFDHSDISDLVKVVRYDFKALINKSGNGRSIRLNNLSQQCQNEAKESGEAKETVARIYQRGMRVREIIQLIETLIIYRNYSAHHANERNDLGLSLKVPSTLLRYTELLDLSSAWVEQEQIIRNASIQILTTLFQTDPTNEFRPISEAKAQDIIVEKDPIEDISEKLDQIAISIKEITMPPLQNKSNSRTVEADETIVNEGNDESLEYETIPEILTLARLRQRLLEIRKEIAQSFELDSDETNILSEDIIADIIFLGIQNKGGWSGLPSSSKIQINHPELCANQLRDYWQIIENTLETFDWKTNEFY